MSELLLQFFHIITLITMLEIAPEAKAALWSRGCSSAAARVLRDELENLRLQGLDLIQKRLNLRAERRAS